MQAVRRADRHTSKQADVKMKQMNSFHTHTSHQIQKNETYSQASCVLLPLYRLSFLYPFQTRAYIEHDLFEAQCRIEQLEKLVSDVGEVSGVTSVSVAYVYVYKYMCICVRVYCLCVFVPSVLL